MRRRGISETVAMKISGPKTAHLFRRYNITDARDLAEATKKIEAGLQVAIPVNETYTKTYITGYAH
jgi:hypothetical protein